MLLFLDFNFKTCFSLFYCKIYSFVLKNKKKQICFIYLILVLNVIKELQVRINLNEKVKNKTNLMTEKKK